MAAEVKPKRIQRKRVKGWRMPEGAVYVGRPTKWGNPFKLGEPILADSDLRHYIPGGFPQGPLGLQFASISIADPQHVVAAYFDWLVNNPPLWLTAPKELRGKDLACWCALDVLCHADVLLEIANS